MWIFHWIYSFIHRVDAACCYRRRNSVVCLLVTVCMFVCVLNTSEPCKNGWTDPDAVRESLVSPSNSSASEVTTLWRYINTHTQPFNGLRSGTTSVGRYQKKYSPTHTRPDHRTSFIIFLHLQRSVASSLFILRAWQSSSTTSPGPFWSSSWSWTHNFILHTFLHPIIIIFSQHMPIPTQPVLLQYQCYVIYTWSATTFSFLTGQVSLPCNMLLRTQLLYNLPLIIKII